MPDLARTIGGWPWREMLLAVVGLVAGGYIAVDGLDYQPPRWHLIGSYALFAVLFVVFAVVRRQNRALFIGAWIGMTLVVALLVLVVTG